MQLGLLENGKVSRREHLLQKAEALLTILSPELLAKDDDACLRLRFHPFYSIQPKEIQSDIESESKGDYSESSISPTISPLHDESECLIWNKSLGALLTTEFIPRETSSSEDLWLQTTTEGVQGLYCMEKFTERLCLSSVYEDKDIYEGYTMNESNGNESSDPHHINEIDDQISSGGVQYYLLLASLCVAMISSSYFLFYHESAVSVTPKSTSYIYEASTLFVLALAAIILKLQ